MTDKHKKLASIFALVFFAVFMVVVFWVAGIPMIRFVEDPTQYRAWKDDLRRCVEKLHIQAVRLVPGFHGYALTGAVMEEVSDALRAYQLPLIITLRMRDDRTAWMLQPRNIPLEELAAFLDSHRDIPTLLAHVRTRELRKLNDQFAGRDNLFADTSGFKDDMLPLDFVWQETNAREKIVYGSCAPLMEMQATTILVDKAELDNNVKTNIFCGQTLLTFFHKA